MAVDKVQFTLRLDSITYTKIKKIAKEENRSITNMLEYIIIKYIKSYEKKYGEIKLSDFEINENIKVILLGDGKGLWW